MDSTALCGLRFSRSVSLQPKQHQSSSISSAITTSATFSMSSASSSSSTSSSSPSSTAGAVLPSKPAVTKGIADPCDDLDASHHRALGEYTARVDQTSPREDGCDISDLSSGNDADTSREEGHPTSDPLASKKGLLDLHELDTDASLAALCAALRDVARTRDDEIETEDDRQREKSVASGMSLSSSSSSSSSSPVEAKATNDARLSSSEVPHSSSLVFAATTGRRHETAARKREAERSDSSGSGSGAKNSADESMKRRLRAPVVMRRLSSVMARLQFSRRTMSKHAAEDNDAARMASTRSHAAPSSGKRTLHFHTSQRSNRARERVFDKTEGEEEEEKEVVAAADGDGDVEGAEENRVDDESAISWSSRSRATSAMTATTTATNTTMTTATGSAVAAVSSTTRRRASGAHALKQKRKKQGSGVAAGFYDDEYTMLEPVTPASDTLLPSSPASRPPLVALRLRSRRRSTAAAQAEAARAEAARAEAARVEAARVEAVRESAAQAQLLSETRSENDRLRERVATLEMDTLELDTLRGRVSQLEWALDVVRDDADRVRDDALALLASASEPHSDPAHFNPAAYSPSPMLV